MPRDGTLDRITSIAAAVFGVPIAVVSIVGHDRIWFESHQGIDVQEMPREPGLCASAILQSEPWIIADAKADPRTQANSLVSGQPGVRFYAGIPLTTREGHNLGMLCVMDTVPRDVSGAEPAILEGLAGVVTDELELRLLTHDVLTVETSLRKEAEAQEKLMHQLADTLQTSLLPPNAPEIPGFEVATCYVPAGPGQVGGDFFDIFPLASKSWGILIGDVSGKGPEAATMTALARYSIRAVSMDTRSPARVLDTLNRAMVLRHDSEEGKFCTVAFGRLIIRPDRIQFHASCGGHPQPIILRASGAVETVGGAGPLIGAFLESQFTTEVKDVEPGDSIIFFTDGVTEARGSECFGEERLSALIASCAGDDASQILEKIRDAATGFATRPRDDVAIMVLRVSPTSRPGERRSHIFTTPTRQRVAQT
ncbi:MAG: PP2C family protein-serine/threonine phosphatase [Actinomycetota bacterium]